jgi:chromosomal replication initiation ATPase DnaA
MSQALYGMNEETRQHLTAIARKHGVTLEALRAKGKFKVLCDARRECYTYLHQERGWSTPQIGGFFNRDHTTVCWWLDNQGSLERKRERARRAKQTEKLLGARRVA